MLSKRKILLVENDYFQFNLLKDFLHEQGFGVLLKDPQEIISSFDEALEIIKIDLPDLAILDIEINGTKDGIELAEYLQPLNIPVIFLTARDNDQNLARARKLMPNGFITKTEKPYNERQLRNAITLALEYVDERKKLLSKSISLKVKEVKLNMNNVSKSSDEDKENIKKEKLFEWSEIKYFYTGKDSKNYIIVKTDSSDDIGYEFKESLSEFELKTPIDFVRVSRNYLVNALKITEHDLPSRIYVDKETIQISDQYRDSAPLKIKRILGI